jgi:hypothetical protein
LALESASIGGGTFENSGVTTVEEARFMVVLGGQGIGWFWRRKGLMWCCVGAYELALNGLRFVSVESCVLIRMTARPNCLTQLAFEYSA